MPEAELIDGPTALARHRDEWERIAVERSNAFVTPQWFECWLNAYADQAAIGVVEVRDGERLLGLLPVATEGSGPLRVTRIAGANLADLLHPVAAAEDESAVGSLALALVARESGTKMIVLDNVDGGSDWWSGSREARWRERQRGDAPGPYASLAGLDYEQYLAGRSSSFRKRLRQIERGLAKEAQVSFRLSEGESQARTDMATFFDLHDRRWADRGGSSLAAPRARAFHLNFAVAAARRSWLRLWIAEADGEPIAASYGWRVGGRQAFYQSGLDERFAKHSVGLLMQANAIAAAIVEGVAEYDMLLGGESYKARFCDRSRDLRTVVVFRPASVAGLALAAELAGRRAVQALPDGTRDRVRAGMRGLNERLPTGRRR